MELAEIKEYLDQKVLQYNCKDFISEDPVQFPHRYSKLQDIEIMGFLIATISWGNRNSILKSGNRLMQILEDEPYEFVMDYSGQPLNFVHRTFNSIDLSFFLYALKNIYKTFPSLEDAFYLKPNQIEMKQRILNFRGEFLAVPHELRSEKHLSNPAKGSSAKRVNMFLRWMVRKDDGGVDLGLWNTIQPSELYLPLDVHTGNISRELGILKRKQNDWKALEEVQQVLRQFDPIDPVKYDFALFGIGVNRDL